ncbi:MAG: FMN-binding protein [Clostridia bacterium]|nr:FMN-binding protein [Clostridia bacterium]
MLKVVLWIVIGLVVLIGGMIVFGLVGLRSGKDLPIGIVDFSKLQDGAYTGQYKGGRWSNRVRVTVESGRVTGIDVVQDITFHQPEVRRQTINAIVEAQSLQVDTVSGATITAKAYLKAVENALTAAE